MTWLVSTAVSFLCAALSALGMGGGGLLLIYLTVYAGMDQLAGQSINLVFFVPVSITAIFFHAKNKLIRWKIALRCVILGVPGVYFGWKLAMLLEAEYLSRLFGVLLLVIGLRELLSQPKGQGGPGKVNRP